MRSDAQTVEDYLEGLPEERRAAISLVRDLVNEHLPDGYVERMGYGMISWGIPLEDYPSTYNKQPLTIASLAAQKNYMSLYLMGCYTDGPEEKRLRERYDEAGLRLDLGKCCLRFKRLADVHLDAVAEAVEAVPPEELIRRYEESRAKR
jgi:hypothetical protein